MYFFLPLFHHLQLQFTIIKIIIIIITIITVLYLSCIIILRNEMLFNEIRINENKNSNEHSFE